MFLTKEIIENKKIIIGIIGLGYVGLPLAIHFLNENINVIGFDIDQKKIDILNCKKSYLASISNDEICDYFEKSIFQCTSDFSKISNCNVIIICVPTPLTLNDDPDLSHIISTCEAITPFLSENSLVILESTTWPGTQG